MKRSHIDEILSKVKKQASAVSQVRAILPAKKKEQPKSVETPVEDEEEYVPVGVKGLVAASQKLLAVNRGLDKTDARDSLIFKRILTTDKLLADRIKVDEGRLRGAMLPLIARHKNLRAVGPFVFDPYMEKFLIGNPLSSPLEEINPLHLLEQARRATQMGPGGIGTDNAITEEMQCHSADSSVFTRKGWKQWVDVTIEDELACLIKDRIEFHKPEALYAKHYEGIMYGVKSRSVNFLVTPNHRMWTASSARTAAWAFEYAAQHHGKYRVYKSTSLPYQGTDNSDFFEIPAAPACAKGDKPNSIAPIAMRDWCEFLGWYMAEGSRYNQNGNHYRVVITQCPLANPEKYECIEALLRRLPFKFHKNCNNFIINSKALYLYVDQFGYSADKYLPDFIFELKPEYRRIFLNAFCLGDGNKNKSGARIYSSSSKKLVEGIERLILMDGGSASRGNPWKAKKRDGNLACWMHRTTELKTSIKEVKPNNHFISRYNGIVYCASVPGGLLLTKRGHLGCPFYSGNSINTDQFGFLSPLEGPESEKIGIDTRMAWGSKIGSDGKPYQKFLDRRTGKIRWMSPEDLDGLTVKLPD